MAPPKIRPSTSPDIGSIPPAAPGSDAAPPVGSPSVGPGRRSGAADALALRGIAGSSGPRLARGVFGTNTVAKAEGRVINVPAPGVTVGDALGRLRDEHPDFSGNPTQMQVAWDARLA